MVNINLRGFPRAVLPLLLVLPVGAMAAQDAVDGVRSAPVADVADAAEVSDAAAGAEAASVLRAQVLLDRRHFSPGEIDGVAGSNVAKAVLGFQRSQGLAASGELDAATWAALEIEAVPTLVDYTLRAEDVAGPFAALPRDMIEKSKLPALGFASAAEALGEQVEQAGRARHDRQGASIAEGDVLRPYHGGVAEPGVMLHCLPATGVGATLSAWQAAVAHLNVARTGQCRLLWPLLEHARLRDCSLPGIGTACLLLGMQGEQHQQKADDEGHGIDRPEFVLERKIADPGAHAVIVRLVAFTIG